MFFISSLTYSIFPRFFSQLKYFFIPRWIIRVSISDDFIVDFIRSTLLKAKFLLFAMKSRFEIFPVLILNILSANKTAMKVIAAAASTRLSVLTFHEHRQRHPQEVPVHELQLKKQ